MRTLKLRGTLPALLTAWLAGTGCVTLKAPENIIIDGRPRSQSSSNDQRKSSDDRNHQQDHDDDDDDDRRDKADD